MTVFPHEPFENSESEVTTNVKKMGGDEIEAYSMSGYF
jgi:hypothetical protein